MCFGSTIGLERGASRLPWKYDVVETSDIEELEELKVPLYSTKLGLHNAYLGDYQHSPRKRAKLCHSSPNTDGKECQHASQLLSSPTVPTSSLTNQGPVISRDVDNNTALFVRGFSPSLVRDSSQDPLLLMSNCSPSREYGSPTSSSIGDKHSRGSMTLSGELNSPSNPSPVNTSVLTSLFTPPKSTVKRRPVTMPPSTPQKTTLDSMPSSPLTVLESPQVPTVRRPTSAHPQAYPLANLIEDNEQETTCDPTASDVSWTLSQPLPRSIVASEEHMFNNDFPRHATPLSSSSSPRRPHEDQVAHRGPDPARQIYMWYHFPLFPTVRQMAMAT